MIDFNQPIRLKVPLGDVPEGDQITKLTGEKVYTVRDSIMVYGEAVDRKRELERHAHTYRFLFSKEGTINEMSRDRLVIWITTMEMLRFYAAKQEREQQS